MHRTQNTLKLIIREKSVNVLNIHLAAAIDLQGQLKQAHWNVRGPGFIAIHELFDKIATEVADVADQFAERVGALGGTAIGTIQMAVKNSFMVPYTLEIADTHKHVFAVAAALAGFAQSTRAAAVETGTDGDADTSDLFTQVSRGIEHQLWFVESHNLPTAA